LIQASTHPHIIDPKTVIDERIPMRVKRIVFSVQEKEIEKVKFIINGGSVNVLFEMLVAVVDVNVNRANPGFVPVREPVADGGRQVDEGKGTAEERCKIASEHDLIPAPEGFLVLLLLGRTLGKRMQ
jgi:hypothetical protein